jgi:hypothetical protein
MNVRPSATTRRRAPTVNATVFVVALIANVGKTHTVSRFFRPTVEWDIDRIIPTPLQSGRPLNSQAVSCSQTFWFVFNPTIGLRRSIIPRSDQRRPLMRPLEPKNESDPIDGSDPIDT